MQGRFTGVDPEQVGASTNDPQSWNGYAYARSNPTLYTDPDGKKYLVCDPNGKNCQEISDDAFYAARRADTKDGLSYTGSRDFFENGQVKNGNGDVLFTYVQTSIDDLDKQYIFAIRGAVNPIPRATAEFFALSAAIGTGGGVAYFYLGSAATVTTLGLASRAAPAAAGAAGVFSQLSKGDAAIFEKAVEYGLSKGNDFLSNVAALTRATVESAPGRDVTKIGDIGNSPIYGSLVTHIGIAQVEGQTVLVKMMHGNPQILGPP